MTLAQEKSNNLCMAVSFHTVQLPPNVPTLACDECGCLVDQSDRGRSAHKRWHEQREEIVVDLRAVKTLVA